MAVPSRLATGYGLHRAQQVLSGASIYRRECNVVPGAAFCSCNALPSSTSLPRLGPESPLRIRSPGEVIVDSTLLAAPVRRAVFRQDENSAGVRQSQEGNHDGSVDGHSDRPSVAATDGMLPPLHPAGGTGQLQTGWIGLQRRATSPEVVNSAVDQRPAGPSSRLCEASASGTNPSQNTSPASSPHQPTFQPGTATEPTAALEWTLRSPEQQHLPLSPPSVSSDLHPGAAGRGRGDRLRGAGGTAAAAAAVTDPRRHHTLLSRVLAATNWYELRAILISGGGGGGGGGDDAATLAANPSAVLAVLRRLAAVTSYDMRPPESAQLGSFLERWLLQHTEALRHMGPAELSLCLHSLAKLARVVPAPPPAWTAAWFAAAQPYLLQYGFRPKDLSLSLWALSKLQLRLPPAAVQLLLAATEPHLPRFNGQDMSLLALALSTLQSRSVSGHGAAAAAASTTLLPSAAWQAAFLERCAAVLPECGSQALANLLHGMIRAGFAAPDWLLGDLCAALYGKLPECTPQALANVLSALAVAGYVPEEGWVERFLAESAARMAAAPGVPAAPLPGGWGAHQHQQREDAGVRYGGGVRGGGGGVCNLDDLTHLAAAAAQLALAPPRWWVARLYGAMEEQLSRGSPRQLAQLLHAVAQLYRSPLPAAAPPPRSLLAAWHRAAAAALPGFNSVDAAHSLWALAALGERPPGEWLQRLLVTCRGGLAAAPPGDLAVLTWSLAALRFRPTWSWLADVVEASEPALYGMSGQDFAMLSTALVRLGCRPQRSWSVALLGALAGRLGRLEIRALSQTAWALYRLRVQPPPEWLEALAGELRRRWREQAAAVAGGREGDGGGGREELRHTVVLLWVVCMWLGRQQWRGERPGLGGGVAGGRKRRPARGRSGAVGLGPLRRLRMKWRGADDGRAASSAASGPLERDFAGGDAGAAAGAVTAMAVPAARQRSCRITARMLRRRRAAKRENLVAGLGGDVRAAAAFRRRIADQLLGPAMAAMAPALADGHCTPQDLALLGAVARRLPREARRAAAAQPAWRLALLAAATPRLGALPAAGLVQLLGGLQALQAPVEPGWAAAAARAADAHLSALHVPATTKVALLRGLCGLQVSIARPSVSPPQAAPAVVLGTSSPWAPVLETGLRTLRHASATAQPQLQLEVELLRARVRLRKLSSLAGPAGGAAAVAALRRLAAARSTAAAAATAEYDAAELQAAAAEVRAAVAAAAATVVGAGAGAAPDEDMDEAEESEAEWRRRGDGQGGAVRHKSRRLPPIGEGQRAWIRARAHRTVASRMADSSPVLVAQLVVMVSEHCLAAAAATPNASPSPPSHLSAPSCRAQQRRGPAAVQGAAVEEASSAPDAQCRAASLQWLAAATRRWWRAMLPAHRAHVALAWRHVLGSLAKSARDSVGGPSANGSSSIVSCRSSDRGTSNSQCGGNNSNNSSCNGSNSAIVGVEEVGLVMQLRAVLPPSVTAEWQGRRWRRRHSAARGDGGAGGS